MEDPRERNRRAKAEKLVDQIDLEIRRDLERDAKEPLVAEHMAHVLLSWTPAHWAKLGRDAGFEKPPDTSIPLVIETFRQRSQRRTA
jgi:hypothetical protein